MNDVRKLSSKKLLFIVSFTLFTLIGTVFLFFFSGKFFQKKSKDSNTFTFEDGKNKNETQEQVNSCQSSGNNENIELIYIDLEGAVNNPGVHKVPAGSIIQNAIEVAGGFSQDADLEFVSREINKASIVVPNSYLYIPKKGELSNNTQSLERAGQANAVYSSKNFSSYSTSQASSSSSGQNSLNTNKQSSSRYAGVVNINTASKSELETLSGIGPTKAQAIIDYRNKYGPFSSPSDIMKVSGIGYATYQKNADRITV